MTDAKIQQFFGTTCLDYGGLFTKGIEPTSKKERIKGYYIYAGQCCVNLKSDSVISFTLSIEELKSVFLER